MSSRLTLSYEQRTWLAKLDDDYHLHASVLIWGTKFRGMTTLLGHWIASQMHADKRVCLVGTDRRDLRATADAILDALDRDRIQKVNPSIILLRGGGGGMCQLYCEAVPELHPPPVATLDPTIDIAVWCHKPHPSGYDVQLPGDNCVIVQKPGEIRRQQQAVRASLDPHLIPDLANLVVEYAV